MNDQATTTEPTFGIGSFASHATANGVAYAGTVTKDGAVVGSFEQDGNGGADRFYFEDHATREAFEAEVARLLPDADFEPETRWIIGVLDRTIPAPLAFRKRNDPDYIVARRNEITREQLRTTRGSY